MPPLVMVILQNLPLLFSDATLAVEWVKTLKAHGVDVDAQVTKAMADADLQVKRLLNS